MGDGYVQNTGRYYTALFVMGIRVLYPHTATYHNFVRTAEQKWICDLQKCGDFMTYKEAADRIEEHARIHYRQEYPRANLITEIK